MASNIVIAAVTPHSIDFRLVGDNGVPGAVAAATLIAAAAEGPLKQLLTQLNAAGALASLNTNGARAGLVRIRKVEGVAAQQTQTTADTITWGANGLSVVQGTAGSVGQYEMRLAQSVER